MGLVELHVIFGNSATNEWKNVAKLDVAYFVEPDFSQGQEALKKQDRERFQKVELPNGEAIEIAVLYREAAENFALHVKQDTDPILQVLCEGMPQIVFRTLAGADVNIQVHPRGFFDGGNG